MKIQNRRKFFRNITLSAIGVSLLNSLPVKLFAGQKSLTKKTVKNVEIHNQAVKRSK